MHSVLGVAFANPINPMESPMPTLEEFDAYIVQLGNHDWTFEYSDDGNVWRRGKDQQRKLIAQASLWDVLMAAYTAYINYTYADDKTSWPDRLIKRANTITELRKQIQIAMTVELLKAA